MISVISRASHNSVKSNAPRSFRATQLPSSLSLAAINSASPSPTPTRHHLSTLSTRPNPRMSSPPSSKSSATPTPTTSIRSTSPPSSISSAPSMHTSTKPLSPFSFVDTAALDAQMKLASINHLAGYSTKSYPAPVAQLEPTEYTPEEMSRGYQVLREPAWNKGESELRANSDYRTPRTD